MTDVACQQETSLAFVAAVNNVGVLRHRLYTSECLRTGRYPLRLHYNCKSAAQAFNPELHGSLHSKWLVWVHQDVILPKGWDLQFRSQLHLAMQSMPHLAVVGVYGVSAGAHVGCVLDRGEWLCPPGHLPCTVDALDELSFAVRRDSNLLLDPALGFDFYATDLVLTARARGFDSAVLHAPCEHWSSVPPNEPLPLNVAERIRISAEVFERKWAHALPIITPCVHIDRAGDSARHIARLQGL